MVNQYQKNKKTTQLSLVTYKLYNLYGQPLKENHNNTNVCIYIQSR